MVMAGAVVIGPRRFTTESEVKSILCVTLRHFICSACAGRDGAVGQATPW